MEDKRQIAISQKVGLEILEILGIPNISHLIEAHIHIKYDTIVTVDCVYEGSIDKNGVFVHFDKTFKIKVEEVKQ